MVSHRKIDMQFIQANSRYSLWANCARPFDLSLTHWHRFQRSDCPLSNRHRRPLRRWPHRVNAGIQGSAARFPEWNRPGCRVEPGAVVDGLKSDRGSRTDPAIWVPGFITTAQKVMIYNRHYLTIH